MKIKGFPGGFSRKESACQCSRPRDLGLIDPLEKGMATHSSMLACLEKSHGQRSLAGCSTWGAKVSDTT